MEKQKVIIDTRGETREISVDLTPERHPDESFKDYKERRAYNNNLIRKWLQGRLVWHPSMGIYHRKKDT
jgi:hypothetical protein